MTALISILALIVVLGVLVFVHEAGHFLAAKAAGIHVHRFAIGIGSPIKALTFTRGETEYAICWLPLGGYVKMATNEEDATSSALEGATPAAPVAPERVFEAKPVWVRMVVILAGVFMNGLFAWGAFSLLVAKNGQQFDPETRVGLVITDSIPEALAPLALLQPGDSITAVNGQPVHTWDEILQGITFGPSDSVVLARADREPVVLRLHRDALEERSLATQLIQPYRLAVVDRVVPGDPAERGGLAPGDTIVAVNGQPLQQWYDLQAVLRESALDTLVMDVGRAGGRTTVTVVPREEQLDVPGISRRTVGWIGIAPRHQFTTEPVTLPQALRLGAAQTVVASTAIVRSVRGILFGRVSGRSLGGPIAIGQMAGQAASLGFDPFLGFMAFISVNLAVLNLLPIPVLDGGQFLFLLAEGVIRRPLSLKLRERLTMVGLVFILLLMVFVFSNDILRLFGI